MSENEDLVEIFKKSISSTVKSIGKINNAEINFVNENSSIEDNKINITLPNIDSIKKNLDYIRGEADIIALELRLHKSSIHK